MKNKNTAVLDQRSTSEKIRSQFSGLDPNDPSMWPALPRNLLLLFVCAAVITLLWFVWLKDVDQELVDAKAQEVTLRTTYQSKLVQAVNLEELKKQLEQVKQYVSQLEKKLPSKAEMDALLSDINQAGLGRSLQFEVFRPGSISLKEYYAELPIAVRVTGQYHDIGAFASDIANLSRIVTLNNIALAPVKDKNGLLTMDCTAKTFRYLDEEEIAAQQRAQAEEAKKKGAAK